MESGSPRSQASSFSPDPPDSPDSPRSSGPPLVRIAVLQSGTARSVEHGHRTIEALERLGREVQLERPVGGQACLSAVANGAADLVLLDCADAADRDGVLDALCGGFPPVVVITRESGDDAALDAFRRGAADCVRVGDDYDEVLPVVVLEQLHRSQQQRERVAAERRIAELQRTNENIIQTMSSALLVVDVDGRITFANPTAERILRAPAGGLVGALVWDWFGAEREEAVIARTIREGVCFKGAETAITLADGPVVPIGISCTPLCDAHGEREGAVAVFQDLSEIKQLQLQVLQSEKMASIGQLAAGVAHEINNPMGFIHANLFQMTEYLADLRRVWGRVEGLQKAAAGRSPDEVERAASDLADVSRSIDVDFVLSDFAKALRESQEGSERIRHIVSDLRDFAHTDTGEKLLGDVNQCVDSTAHIVWTMMKHSVELEKSYSELPRVICFPMQLKQVFMNLLVNAYQAIEQRVGDSGEIGRVRIATRPHEGGVVVSIADTGTGIAQEDLNRIFDPFFTTKAVGAGTGLGLSTSYSIVRRHGGTIRVDSRVGEGTTFEVWLPKDGVGEPGDVA